MPATDPTPEAEARANELYWSSDHSVNQIADDLDLSKGTLYGLIRPLNAELACPVCADELVWPNRTARAKGLVACPSCEWEGEADDAESLDGAAAGMGAHAPHGPLASRPSPERMRTVLGGALLGAAAGLAMILWARRR